MGVRTKGIWWVEESGRRVQKGGRITLRPYKEHLVFWGIRQATQKGRCTRWASVHTIRWFGESALRAFPPPQLRATRS